MPTDAERHRTVLEEMLNAVRIGSPAWALLSWRIRCLEHPEQGPRYAGHAIAPLVEAALARVPAAPTGAEREAYHELLYAVAQKFPGESRHETALRYIRQAEQRSDSIPSAAQEPTEGRTL
jgi:hypothetical protein